MKPWKTGTISRYITNLKQSILETFDIYGTIPKLIKLPFLAHPTQTTGSALKDNLLAWLHWHFW